MYDNHTISFVSFANSRYASQERIKREAEEMRFFDYIYVGDEHMLEPWYYKKYKDRWSERGYGYWQWKPYIIRRVIDRMEEGDYLVYADAGCTLNPRGIPRLKEYLQMVTDSPCGVLGFDQHFREAEWTKADLFDHFRALDNPMYMDYGQTSGTCIYAKALSTSGTTSCISTTTWLPTHPPSCPTYLTYKRTATTKVSSLY